MKRLVEEIRTKKITLDGKVFEDFFDWKGNMTELEVRKAQAAYFEIHPIVKVEKYIVLDGGQQVILPFVNIPKILPDRTGVLVVFEQHPSKFSCCEAPWFFDFPSNAAIYNADGSLRFQLHNPAGSDSYIGAVHTGAMPDHPDTLGVLVGTVGHDPEWLYLVDCNNPEIISTGKWIRY